MIARLEGVVIEKDPPHVVIDCNGVGYDVICSGYTLTELPPDGERVTLRVFTHATENKLSLFGFIDRQERTLFDLLITVKNVGPSTAIAILSGSNPRDIATLISNEDVPGLTRIKGVGKKTAELLVVELKDKAAEALMMWDAGGGLRPVSMPASIRSVKATKRHPVIEEVATALVGMGWKPQEADQAVVELPVPPDAKSNDPALIAQLLRQALRSMPR
ncbi:MAG TPA: Holliday junction branch migration protein RuvA [Kofleriaceae bacterium]|nr:Holliday junction branch migration protein RuvA [Kofleriaceae bacterium]